MRSQIRVLLAIPLCGIVAVILQSRAAAPAHAQAADPCATLTSMVSADAARASGSSAPGSVADGEKARPLDHDDRWRHLDSLWAHRAAVAQRRVAPASVGARSQDVGEI